MKQQTKQQTTKQKNELRNLYEYAKEFYPQIFSAWKESNLTLNEYNSFMRTQSFLPVAKVETGITRKIDILRKRLDIEAQNVRNNETA